MDTRNKQFKRFLSTAKNCFVIGVFVLVCAVLETNAKTLAQYKEDINHIKKDFASLSEQGNEPNEEIKSTESSIYEELPA